MSLEYNVGEVFVSSKEVLWRITNFSAMLRANNTIIISPYFTFTNEVWRLFVFPNGHRKHSSLGWFEISAYVKFTSSDELFFELGIKNKLQKNIVSSRVDYDVSAGEYSCRKLIRRREFDSLKRKIMLDGNLYIFLRIVSESEDSTFHADRNKTQDGVGKLIPKQEDATSEKSTQTEGSVGVWKLKQNLEKLLLNESITDVILKVHDQEYKAHRCILAASSPVFLAMMSHDTKERNTGIVDIQDCNPTIIPDFLHYLYTGSIENFSSEKTLKLYLLADKYQVNELKQTCMDHLMTNISVDNFCDVINLSLQYNEENLKDACIQFFQETSLDIVMTSNWQSFLSENPIVGNELYIKNLQFIKSPLQERSK